MEAKIEGSLRIATSIKNPLMEISDFSFVIGEGVSGAVAMGMETVMMLEHSIYSVISPEGCASILMSNKLLRKAAKIQADGNRFTKFRGN